MARIAVRAVIDVIPDFPVLFVHQCFFVRMTCRARENGKVRWVDVAIVAGRPPVLVRAGVDRKRVVNERRAHPSRGAMASSAVGWEARRNVIGIRNRRVLGLMAGEAIGRRAGVSATDVATGAGRRCVRSGERKRRATVIKAGGSPGGGAVTHLAFQRKCGGLVIRIRGAVVIGQMA